MRRTRKLTSCIVGLGSGLLLSACAPTSFENVAETNDALSQGLGGESEPNDGIATATPIGNDTVVRAKIFQTGADVDYFAFQGTTGDKVYAATITAFSPAGSDTTLALFQPDGTTLIEQDLDDGSLSGTSSSIAGATLTQTGTHYARVISPSLTNSGSIRPYDLHFRTQSGSPVAEVEPNDIAPNPLPASGWVSGALSSATDVDVYAITVNAGDTISASLDLDPLRDNTPWNGQLLVGPFGPTNAALLVNDGSTAAMNSEAFPITVKNAGTYFVAVNAPTGVVAVGDYNLSVSVHPATPATANCTTYTSTDVPKTIPDGPGLVSSTIVIPGNPRIADMDISLNLNHTLPQDLDITLTSPAGNTNGIVTDVGGGAATPFTAWDVIFDDEAAIPGVGTLLNGIVYQPRNSFRLEWFDGENAGGTWTLNLHDDTALNGGTLNNWSITICEPPAAPTCAGGTPLQPVFTTDFESGADGFTHSGTQDEWELGTPTFAPVIGCNSGTNCWKTDLDAAYNASSTQDLVSAPIDLTNALMPVRLQWAMKYQVESASFDHAWVEVREVGGANPRHIWDHTSATMTTSVGNPSVTVQESAGWGEFSADVSAYVGKQIELVFHLDTDSSVHLAGLAIDDVSVSACSPCGNGLSDPGEACDDGNTTNGDGCDSNCTVTACGNGIATMGEACDDGNATEGDGCDSNCTVTACGNGVVSMTTGEDCDDGNATDGDGCDNNCTATACGNGVVTMGEACDDGNMTDGDGCDNNCTATACGNGVVTMGEGCDDGNMTDGDGCDNNCTLTACGNGVVTMGEVCDDGNAINGDGCDNNCTMTACGNGVATMGEACDDGNAVDGDGCDTNCTLTACGNGILTMGEACDDGNATDDDGCDSNCTATACGNGVVTTGETCDDGNMTSGDGCDNNCTASACGNGVQAGGEGCDDGNTTDDDGCDSNCTVTGCGNGVLTTNEACDDGNTTNGDGCDNNCTASACGNGVTGDPETCDDGNTTDGDGCDSNCTPTGCGNGIMTDPEECDDGNTTDGDGCAADCTTEGAGGAGGGGGAGGTAGAGGAGGTGEGGAGGAGGDTTGPIVEGGCNCTTVGNTESTKSSFFALFGLFGMLAAKLRRRK